MRKRDTTLENNTVIHYYISDFLRLRQRKENIFLALSDQFFKDKSGL